LTVHQRHSNGCNSAFTLFYEETDFIQAVTPPLENYPNFAVSSGPIWLNVFLPHLLNGDDVMEFTYDPMGCILTSGDDVRFATTTRLSQGDFHTWKVSSAGVVVLPMEELHMVVELADRLKCLVQWRFGLGGAPLLIELVCVGGSSGRFVVSCIEGPRCHGDHQHQQKGGDVASDPAGEDDIPF
jgi:hypothetical protein